MGWSKKVYQSFLINDFNLTGNLIKQCQYNYVRGKQEARHGRWYVMNLCFDRKKSPKYIFKLMYQHKSKKDRKQGTIKCGSNKCLMEAWALIIYK